MAIKSNIKDLNKLMKNLTQVVSKKSVELGQKMLEDTADGAKGEEGYARLASPTINVDKLENGASLVVSTSKEKDKRHRSAAYVEFGTGQYVFKRYSIQDGADDAAVKNYAQTFYVNGRGKIPQAPYLFPNFFRSRDQFIENMKKELERIKKL